MVPPPPWARALHDRSFLDDAFAQFQTMSRHWRPQYTWLLSFSSSASRRSREHAPLPTPPVPLPRSRSARSFHPVPRRNPPSSSLHDGSGASNSSHTLCMACHARTCRTPPFHRLPPLDTSFFPVARSGPIQRTRVTQPCTFPALGVPPLPASSSQHAARRWHRPIRMPARARARMACHLIARTQCSPNVPHRSPTCQRIAHMLHFKCAPC